MLSEGHTLHIRHLTFSSFYTGAQMRLISLLNTKSCTHTWKDFNMGSTDGSLNVLSVSIRVQAMSLALWQMMLKPLATLWKCTQVHCNSRKRMKLRSAPATHWYQEDRNRYLHISLHFYFTSGKTPWLDGHMTTTCTWACTYLKATLISN